MLASPLMESEGDITDAARVDRVMPSTATCRQLRHYAASAIKAKKWPMLNTVVAFIPAQIAREVKVSGSGCELKRRATLVTCD